MQEQSTPVANQLNVSPPLDFTKRRVIAAVVDGFVNHAGDHIWTLALDDLVVAVQRAWNNDVESPVQLDDDDLPLIRQRFQRAMRRQATQA